MKELQLRPLLDADIPQFKTWAYQDYIEKWYAPVEDWLYEIEHRHDEFSWIKHFIVVLDNKDIGFCQYYEYKCGGEDFHGDIALDGLYSIDYFIGEKAYLKKGLGKAIILELSKKIFDIPEAKRIIVQPEIENAASCNALLSAGYAYDEKNKVYLLER